MKKQFQCMFLCTILYAVIRYAGFGDISFTLVPVYLLNKAICTTATECLFMASWSLLRSEREGVRFWTGAAAQLIFVHVFLSLGTLSKGYFPKLFIGDKMNLKGEMVLLLGVIALYCFWRLRRADLAPALRRLLTVGMCVILIGHISTIGLPGWLEVKTYAGGFPPISLLAFLLMASSLLVSLWVRDQRVSLLAEAGAAASADGQLAGDQVISG